MNKTPLQPILKDDRGILRFKSNKIVDYLSTLVNLNQLAVLFPYENYQEDWQQFVQLTGWSVSGFGDLPYVAASLANEAQAIGENPDVDPICIKVAILEDQLNDIRVAVGNLISSSRFSLEELGF